jgi:response regulator RpfG family c-di-GMP phosphodiesterase
MPQLNSFDLYDKIKKEKNNKDLRICNIVTYEIDYEELRKKFPNLHINCFIKKSISNKRFNKESI